ncbi:peptide chain release factor N(5)-glutamine methyltransferase [Gephyromycinifex aptenodytis]|uniref:peptide chain release factor N(5)-glutamine methyltransferase n=1 Tax=Gephyromycinifex aptenodytis TaxID=2716227 RepID=UPI0014466569|nr:peptide chain release factor N(5)-glutamine methyltransferase [Gephyromycinifex aptenodytis]
MSQGARLSDAVALARHRLRSAGVPSPTSDALALLAHAAGVTPGEVERRRILGRTLTQDEAARFAEVLNRRCAREPLQHILGRAPFRGLELAVGPGVFVPRPESESVAGIVIEHLNESPSLSKPLVLDLCTGSGAIALAIKDEVPRARVVAVEASPQALVWARRNVQESGLAVTLREGDAGSACPELNAQVDVVVSNPPYIPPGARPLEVEVAEYDPQMALYGGGDDGLLLPRRIIERAAELLRSGGLFVMEHAEVQSEFLLALLRGDQRWAGVVDQMDLTGRPRALTARRVREPGTRLLDSTP